MNHAIFTPPGGEYSIFEASLLSSALLPSQQVNMADSNNKLMLLNQIFTYLKDITPSPGYLEGWRINKMTAVALGPKSFQELLFKEFKNRKHSGYVDCLQVKSID